jgi:hypothetical protein
MEGITEVFTSFLPRTTIVEANDNGEIATKKKFSVGGLVAMVVYLVLGAGVGALI